MIMHIAATLLQLYDYGGVKGRLEVSVNRSRHSLSGEDGVFEGAGLHKEQVTCI